MSGSLEETERTEETRERFARRSLVLRGIAPGDCSFFPLRKSKHVIGRGEDCDLRLNAGRISRRHVEIYRQGPLVALRDLNSTNGAWVDGKRTRHSAVRHGTLLRVGDWLGVFQEMESTIVPSFSELAPGLFGGPELAEKIELLSRAAKSPLPIALIGPTGAGKERFARAAHLLSGRKGPFQAVNCAALPSALAEAELFGFQKGAFSGADRNHPGQFRAAQHGTIFLDEIGDLPLELQPKLLRVIELQEVTPLGDIHPVALDVRIVVACQSPFHTQVEQGRFRSDLANRLAGFVIHLPALSERRADIPSLFHALTTKHSGGRPPQLGVRLLERLCLYDWPGNARELELLARRMLALYGFEERWPRRLLPAELRGSCDDMGSEEEGVDEVPAGTRDEHELQRLSVALKACDGNMKAAAARIGISRQRAYRLIATARKVDGVE